jgi:hypothetical protein
LGTPGDDALFRSTFTAYEYAPPQLRKKRRQLWDRRRDGELRNSLRFLIGDVGMELNWVERKYFW